MNLPELNEKIQTAKSRREYFIEHLEELEATQHTVSQKNMNVQLAQKFFQTVAEDTQNQIRYHIEKLVQTALDSVFPSIYNFNIMFEQKRGRTEARFFLERDGYEIDIMTGTGGGIADIIAMALRITIFTLSRRRNVIILDEPLKFVSKKYQPIIVNLLSELRNELNIQFIISTHNDEIIESADDIFKVELNKEGISNVNTK